MQNLIPRTTPVNEYIECYNLFHLWRAYDLTSSVFSLVGVFSSTLDYEINYSSTRQYGECEEHSLHTDLFRSITLFSSIISIIFVLLRFYYKDRWLYVFYNIKKRNTLGKKFEKDNSRRKKNLAFEIFILLIFPYPEMKYYVYLPLRINYETVKVCYTLAEIFYCLMLLRFLFLLRSISNYSSYQDDRARLYCERYGVPSNFSFSIKCLLYCYPARVIIFISIFSLTCFSLSYRVFERPLDSFSNDYYSNPFTAFWFMIETMTTLGYGEYFSVSYYGRAICVAAYIVGAILFTLTIVELQSTTQLNPSQNIVFENIVKTKTAAVVVRVGLGYFYYKKILGPAHNMSQKYYLELRKAIIEFKKTRETIDTENDKTSQNIKSLKKDIERTRLQARVCRMEVERFIKMFREDDFNIKNK